MNNLLNHQQQLQALVSYIDEKLNTKVTSGLYRKIEFAFSQAFEKTMVKIFKFSSVGLVSTFLGFYIAKNYSTGLESSSVFGCVFSGLILSFAVTLGFAFIFDNENLLKLVFPSIKKTEKEYEDAMQEVYHRLEDKHFQFHLLLSLEKHIELLENSKGHRYVIDQLKNTYHALTKSFADNNIYTSYNHLVGLSLFLEDCYTKENTTREDTTENIESFREQFNHFKKSQNNLIMEANATNYKKML